MVQVITEIEMAGVKAKLENPIIKITASGGQSITLAEYVAEDICLELERALFEGPTFAELEDENLGLKMKIEDLESEIELLREGPAKRWRGI